MTDLEPCLLGCDLALAEANQLMLLLSEEGRSSDPEVAAVRARIAVLRREVERLRGTTAIPRRRRIHPDWIKLAGNGAASFPPDDGAAPDLQTDGD